MPTTSARSYGDYYQSCVTYAKTFEEKDKIELQFINNQRQSNRGVLLRPLGGAVSQRRRISADAIEHPGQIAPTSARDPDTGERIMAVSCPMIYSNGEVIGVLRYVTSHAGWSTGRSCLVTLVCRFVRTVRAGWWCCFSSSYCIRSILDPVAEITATAKRIAARQLRRADSDVQIR